MGTGKTTQHSCGWLSDSLVECSRCEPTDWSDA